MEVTVRLILLSPVMYLLSQIGRIPSMSEPKKRMDNVRTLVPVKSMLATSLSYIQYISNFT